MSLPISRHLQCFNSCADARPAYCMKHGCQIAATVAIEAGRRDAQASFNSVKWPKGKPTPDADALLLRSKHAIERLCDLHDLMADDDGELLNEITVYLAGRS